MGKKLWAWLKFGFHWIFHCKCCKYCDKCQHCGCRSNCDHSQTLLSSDNQDVETGTSTFRQNETHIQLQHELEFARAEIKERESQIKNLKKKVEEYTQRLSEEMSAKVGASESALENVSIKNRPMNVAEEYQLMCSDEWLAAKTSVDKCTERREDVPEYTRVTVLLEIMRVTDLKVKEAFNLHQHRIDSFVGTLSQPFAGENKLETVDKKKSGDILSLSNSIGDFMKITADSISYEQIVEVVHNSLEDHLRKYHLNECLALWRVCQNSTDIRNFIFKLANIAWKMTVQRPPMTLKFTNSHQGERFQDLHWSSKHVPGAVVYEVYPILYHVKSVMAKGKVLLVDPKEVAR